MKSLLVWATVFSCFAFSATAAETKHFTQLTGSAARVLFQELAKVLPRKNNRIEFNRIVCGMQETAKNEDCQDCKKHRDEDGNKCTPCNEIKSTSTRFCEVNQKRYHSHDFVATELTAALKGIITGKEEGVDNKTIQAISAGFCTTERAHFYCSYDYYTSE